MPATGAINGWKLITNNNAGNPDNQKTAWLTSRSCIDDTLTALPLPVGSGSAVTLFVCYSLQEKTQCEYRIEEGGI